MRFWSLAVALTLVLAPGAAHAKKFRYASGPQPTADSTLSVAEVQLDPIVRQRGPKVAPTNLQLTGLVAKAAIEKALAAAPFDSGAHVTLAPAESHPLNFLVEHAALRALSKRGITATVRRSIVPDDSLALLADGGSDPVLEYQLATARVTYLRLVGGYVLPSRSKIERQSLVEAGLTLRDPASARVLWVGDAAYNLVDVFPRGQLPLVEDERYSELKGALPERNLGRFFEPLVVVGVVTGLVVLFFQNRP